MPDDPTPERPLASEVLAASYFAAGGSSEQVAAHQTAALLACIPDAPHGVTVRPDGTVEAAMPPMVKEASDGD